MRTIIVELAGRDSFVALHRFLKDNPNEKFYFVLSIVAVPPEKFYEHIQKDMLNTVSSYLRWIGHQTIYKIIDGACDDVWFTMLKNSFGSYTGDHFISPCIMCHTFCHLMRLPDAISLCGSILTGERSSHNGKLKVNQNDKVFKLIDEYFESYNVKIIRPLENVYDNTVIKNDYKEFCDLIRMKPEDYKFTSCSLSGAGNVDTIDQLNLAVYDFESKLFPHLDQYVKMIKNRIGNYVDKNAVLDIFD